MRVILLIGALLSTFFVSLNAEQIVLENQGILSNKVVEKITTMGDELKSKTGVHLALVAIEDLNGSDLKAKVLDYYSQLKEPCALIFLTKKEMRVDIMNSADLDKDFDKAQVLSPMPNTGTIIPLLVSRKGQDIYNAALLNGYFDVAEQIGNSRNVELENAIGSSNKIVLNLIRYFIYGSIILVLVVTFYRKRKEENEENA